MFISNKIIACKYTSYTKEKIKVIERIQVL